MAKVLQRLTVIADIVILDTPPLSAVTDAAVLGALVQGAVLVVERGGARVPDVMKSIETLQAVGSDIRGAVLNRAHADEVTAYYYYGNEPGQEQERPQRPSAKGERLPGTVPGTASGE
jgi:Mrp family chromosome partitioning ATPase